MLSNSAFLRSCLKIKKAHKAFVYIRNAPMIEAIARLRKIADETEKQALAANQGRLVRSEMIDMGQVAVVGWRGDQAVYQEQATQRRLLWHLRRMRREVLL